MKYTTIRFCGSGGFLHDEFDDDELSLEQIDTISCDRAWESVGESAPVSFCVDGQEVWSYKDKRFLGRK